MSAPKESSKRTGVHTRTFKGVGRPVCIYTFTDVQPCTLKHLHLPVPGSVGYPKAKKSGHSLCCPCCWLADTEPDAVSWSDDGESRMACEVLFDSASVQKPPALFAGALAVDAVAAAADGTVPPMPTPSSAARPFAVRFAA